MFACVQLVDSWSGHHLSGAVQMSSSPLVGQGHKYGLDSTDTVRRRHVTGEGHNGADNVITLSTTGQWHVGYHREVMLATAAKLSVFVATV